MFNGKKLFQHLDLTIKIIHDFVVDNKGEDLPQIIFIKTQFFKHLLGNPTEIKFVQLYDTGNPLIKC